MPSIRFEGKTQMQTTSNKQWFNFYGLRGMLVFHLRDTASEISGRQIQKQQNVIIQLSQTYDYFTPF